MEIYEVLAKMYWGKALLEKKLSVLAELCMEQEFIKLLLLVPGPVIVFFLYIEVGRLIVLINSDIVIY